VQRDKVCGEYCQTIPAIQFNDIAKMFDTVQGTLIHALSFIQVGAFWITTKSNENNENQAQLSASFFIFSFCFPVSVHNNNRMSEEIFQVIIIWYMISSY